MNDAVSGSVKEPNAIVRYFHCGRCLRELPQGESPQSYASLECGMTPDGFQVWCKRHNVNVVRVRL